MASCVTTTFACGRLRSSVKKIAARGRIEERGRFVEHQNFRVHRQDAGDRDPLLLTGAQMIGSAFERMRHADALQDRSRPRQRIVGGQAQVQRAERHVFQNRGHEQLLVGILKHHADLGADLLERRVGQRQAADFDGAFATQQSVQVQDEGGLAGSVGAEQRHGFSGIEMKVDAVERLGPVGILIAQPANLNGSTQ